jgi:hypothetical protein
MNELMLWIYKCVRAQSSHCSVLHIDGLKKKENLCLKKAKLRLIMLMN